MNTHAEDNINLTDIWLRNDPTRWIAGALAGVFAGLVAMAFAMILAKVSGMEFWFPAKLMATIALGAKATNYSAGFSSIFAGLFLFEALAAFLGVLYAHFTGTNLLNALLGVGLVWGIFSWIFLWCLFFQSFHALHFADISNGAVFPVCLVFGLALTSVAFFDRALRGK